MEANEKNTNTKNYIPVIKCPDCLDSLCYPVELTMACGKCSSTYPVDIKYFNNKVLFNFDNLRLNDYLKNLNEKKKKIDSFGSALMTNVVANEDSLNSFSVVFSGKTLDLLKKIKSENNTPSLMMTIKLIFEGFIYLLKELRNLPGQKVYLVDSQGNKSDDIKRGILKSAYDIFHEEQNKNTVQDFLLELETKFSVDSIKKEINNDDTSTTGNKS